MLTSTISRKSKKATIKTAVAILAVLFLALPGMGLLSVDRSHAGIHSRWTNPNLCSQTAMAAFNAGKSEIKDDYWIEVGNCKNVSDAEERAECLEDAKAEYKESQELSRDQREARLELCEDLGEAAYDPELDPDDFLESVDDYKNATPNRYFPLVPGNKRVYYAYEEGELAERITVEVLSVIKTIAYPALPEEDRDFPGPLFKCIVVNDQRKLALFKVKAFAKIFDFKYYLSLMQSGLVKSVMQG